MQVAPPFEHLTEQSAAALLASVYGIDGAGLERLDTERDDSFRVATATAQYVLKVASPAEDALDINLQTAALGYASEERRLPLQRIVLSLETELEPLVEGRVVRLLTWLPGSPATAPDHAMLGRLGETLGLLNRALSTFDHPAAHRAFEWDVLQLPLLRPALAEFRFDEVEAAFAWFGRLALDDLPRQVIHNDFHPGNVLTDGHEVTGVLDFGDVIYSARVVDLAVAQCYFGRADALKAGFESVVSLRDDEHAALPGLIAARYAARILNNSRLARDNPNALGSIEENRAALRTLLDEES